ncbi:MAG: helix-hairpin-helix domain-containing protein [Patescibacteria group bacterium]|mgnify:CR=1 FL=1
MKIKVALFVAILFFLAIPVFADHSININTADKTALSTLNGIGDVKAQAIIDYRGTNGQFGKIEDIMNVSGIGDATFNKIKDHIRVQGGNSSVTSPASGATPTPPAVSPSNLTPSSTPIPNDFVVDGGSDRTIMVGADVHFSVRANRGKEALDNINFMWNFGDGSTSNGSAVVHKFEYPGRYFVVVSGFNDGVNVTDRFTVIAETAQLLVRVLPDRGVEIENLAKSDADLSRWIIQSAGRKFSLPDNSVIPPRQTMRISPNTLHFYVGEMTELYYQSGALAFRAEEYVPTVASSSVASAVSEPEPVSISFPVRAVDKSSSKKFSQQNTARYEEKADEHLETTIEQELPVASSGVASVAMVAGTWRYSKWWLGAIAIAVFAGGSTFVARRFGRKEWNIIEDTPESA